jgi:hypothetical protein
VFEVQICESRASFDWLAASQQRFSLISFKHQLPAISQQYFSLASFQHRPTRIPTNSAMNGMKRQDDKMQKKHTFASCQCPCPMSQKCRKTCREIAGNFLREGRKREKFRWTCAVRAWRCARCQWVSSPETYCTEYYPYRYRTWKAMR